MTKLPPIGLGTWENDDPEECAESVRTALEVGYRHVDTAEAYGNEAAVGDGIADADVDREEVILATKVHPDSTALDKESVMETARGSLDRLGVDSIDLLYVHWPLDTYDPAETLGAFQSLQRVGVIGRIGVSNFEPDQVDEAAEVLGHYPAANQVELHPFCQQADLIEHAQDNDYAIVAYSPLGRGNVLDHPVIEDVAEEYDASPAQVTLAWVTSHENVVAIPKATSAEHVRDNWAARDLTLDEADVDRIDAIEETERYVDFPEAPWHRE